MTILVMIFISQGCSKPTWLAKIYVVRAEDGASKAHALRVNKKISYEERLKYYRNACHDFLKAYRYDPGIFTLNRIEVAADACLRVKDFDSVEMFRKFEEEYIKQHPNETEYGDAVPWMSLE